VASLTEAQIELFKAKNFAALGTIRRDGTPHVSPVWVDYDGEHIIFNTSRGRAKALQIERDPRVTLAIWSAENAYKYVEVSGIAELTDEGGLEGINHMAKKYLGQDEYPWLKPGEQRLAGKISAVTVRGMQ
jgi:PPOX class probable F420-dependent enzyme